MDNKLAVKTADNIRILSASMVEKSNSGHPGGAMGGADFMTILFAEYLNFDPDDRTWALRDRFFLDPGHMSPMLYSTLALTGAYTLEELSQFRQWGSPTPGHPELDLKRGVENTSGPLGVGHAMGLGAAIAERFYASRFGEWLSHKTYAYISDGGIQEEISQGVGRLAGHLGLSNYIMFYDANDIQLSHSTDVVTSEDTAKKYESWGWAVHQINGNDADEIRSALDKANKETEKPTIIIAKCTMGKGAVDANGNSFEGQCSTHGQPLSKAGASIEKTIENLGGDPKNPFQIFPDVAEEWKKILADKKENASKKQAEQKQWEADNAEKAGQLKKMLSTDAPVVDFSKIEQKEDSATRVASGTVLATFAKEVDKMIVSSADLSNSDNTNKFLDNTTDFARNNFSGKFLQSGVAELTMAAICNGLALHGGIIPVCATFFVFSDYMKPAVRLAALMGLPVKYVWTHDAFRVGEDGPTHQPIEHESQIRLLEKMKNEEGLNSILVLRPADAAETTVAWKMALENTKTPTALILSRQNIKSLPVIGNSAYESALKAEKGARIVKKTSDNKPDLVLVANGSEVATLVEVSDVLSKKGLSVQVVSAISEGVFRNQSAEYQNEVLPFGVPTFGLSAGLADSLVGLVGSFGKAVGMARFGASAPYTVLDEKFGYTVDAVVAKVEDYMAEYKETINKIKSLNA